jgi:3-methyladenine DNA glycosylase AlkD
MHPEHGALREQIRSLGRPLARPTGENDSYGSSGRPFYFVSVPDRRAIARAWAARQRAAEPAEVFAVVDSLLAGESYEERSLASLLLAYHRRARRLARPDDVARWLSSLNGWAEVDGLCQSLFPAEQLLADWPAWRTSLQALAGDANPNKRRASLVLLTGPVKASADPRPAELAFEIIERLKGERDPLITKAVSWLLRALAERHGAAVAAYLEQAAASLPAIAVRETRTKLATGVKTPSRSPPRPASPGPERSPRPRRRG